MDDITMAGDSPHTITNITSQSKPQHITKHQPKIKPNPTTTPQSNHNPQIQSQLPNTTTTPKSNHIPQIQPKPPNPITTSKSNHNPQIQPQPQTHPKPHTPPEFHSIEKETVINQYKCAICRYQTNWMTNLKAHKAAGRCCKFRRGKLQK